MKYLHCPQLALYRSNHSLPCDSASSWDAEIASPSLKKAVVTNKCHHFSNINKLTDCTRYFFPSFLHQQHVIVKGVFWVKSNSQPLQTTFMNNKKFMELSGLGVFVADLVVFSSISLLEICSKKSPIISSLRVDKVTLQAFVTVSVLSLVIELSVLTSVSSWYFYRVIIALFRQDFAGLNNPYSLCPPGRWSAQQDLR